MADQNHKAQLASIQRELAQLTQQDTPEGELDERSLPLILEKLEGAQS